jgi:hypothetical protein
MAETRRTTSATHEGPSGPQAAGPAARDRARVRAGYRFLLARGYDLKVIYSPAGRRGECLARPPELSPLQRRIVSPATAAAMRPHALRVARIEELRVPGIRAQGALQDRREESSVSVGWLILEIIFAVIAGHASDRGFGARPVVFEPAATAMTPASSRSDSSVPAIAKNLKGVTAKTPYHRRAPTDPR